MELYSLLRETDINQIISKVNIKCNCVQRGELPKVMRTYTGGI